MKIFFAFLLFALPLFSFAQTGDDLLKDAGMDSGARPVQLVSATFKSTRVINSQSVETLGKGVLNFGILHRFGRLNSGAYELFGLDQSRIRFGFDYGVTDRLMIGVGRSSYHKDFDGCIKYKLLRQSSGAKNMPITLTYYASVQLRTDTNRFFPEYQYDKDYFSSRLSYVHQLIIGRKFNSSFSFQLSPTLVHRNLVKLSGDKNDVFALGIGGRIKLNRRVSLNGDYVYVFRNGGLADTYNSLNLGFDIETGGHVFQLHFTNSLGMNDRAFMTETDGRWNKGDVHWGFNITRAFSIGKPKAMRN